MRRGQVASEANATTVSTAAREMLKRRALCHGGVVRRN